MDKHACLHPVCTGRKRKMISGGEDGGADMREKMGKMTALINKLRNQNKTYDAKQEKHLAQIKTLEVSPYIFFFNFVKVLRTDWRVCK